MEMKREYLSPAIQILKPVLEYHLLDPSDGVLDKYESKKGEFEEEETGIPNKFSNIWGDEEDED